tara:strand:+ start:558 stop:1106 length:549 start_codon:yes stop_codon:yes gene_type:complete
MKTVKQNLTAAQIRLLDRVILANGLNDNLTFRSLTTKEQKSLYNLRNKALYIYVDSDDKLRLNVSRMINDTDFINYVASKKQDVISEKMDRLKKAREEQSVANWIIRNTGLSAASKYKGLSLFNNIYTFYNEKEIRARKEESKEIIRKERNEILDLAFRIDHTKTYVYSLDNYDYPFESKLK